MSRRAETAGDLPQTFIPCRAFRHEPRFITDHATFSAHQLVVEFKRITECAVCMTRITTTYSVPDFRVLKRKYDYPDMYQVKGGLSVFDARSTYIQNRSMAT